MSKGIARELCDQIVGDILDGNLEHFKEDNPLEYDDLKINDCIGKIQNGMYYLRNPEMECQVSISFVLSFFSHGKINRPDNILSDGDILDRYYWRDSRYQCSYYSVYADKFPKLLKELERIWGLVFDGNRNSFYLLDRKGVTLP